MSITPTAGLAYQIVTGGTAVQVVPANINGGYIVNPSTSADQGIAVTEPIFVDPTGTCGLIGNNTTLDVHPGSSFNLIAGSTKGVWVNANTSGHCFVVVYY